MKSVIININGTWNEFEHPSFDKLSEYLVNRHNNVIDEGMANHILSCESCQKLVFSIERELQKFDFNIDQYRKHLNNKAQGCLSLCNETESPIVEEKSPLNIEVKKTLLKPFLISESEQDFENKGIMFDMPEEQSSIIKVIGVGGGGSNAVNYMYEQGIKGVNFAICNTDIQALEMSRVPNKIQLGPSLTNGRGAGAMPEVGKNATIESEEEIRDLLSINTKMVFITAGMGGGTGTGGAPEVAKIARELGILTVGIVTVPFDFEGKRKRDKAELGIEEMRNNVDALIVISNNKLRDIYGNLSLTQAFGNADSILSTAAKGISEIITKSGLINVDFEDVKTVMQNSGVALMGTGIASGDNRAIQAVDAAMSSPLLSNDDIHGAKGILLNITSGSDEIRMDEVTIITEYVQEAVANETEIIWGVCYDDTLEDEIAVTIIATGFESNKLESLTNIEYQNKDHYKYVSRNERPQTTMQHSEGLDGFLLEDLFVGQTTGSYTIDSNVDEQAKEVDLDMNIHYDENLTESVKPPSMADIQRERMMKLKNIVSFNKIKNNKSLREMENEPAFIRKKVEFSKVQRSDEDFLSKWSLDDDYDNQLEKKEADSNFSKVKGRMKE